MACFGIESSSCEWCEARVIVRAGITRHGFRVTRIAHSEAKLAKIVRHQAEVSVNRHKSQVWWEGREGGSWKTQWIRR